jgi:hypothetical protein
MIPNAVLIQQPAIDFSTFLGLSSQVLGYSPGTSADSSRRQLHDAEKFMSCLAAMKDQHAPVGLSPHLMTHVSFSVLVVADERDMQDILECCSGMAFVITDTVARSVQATVITGTLSQWRDAVISGCQFAVEPSVRALFNRVLSLFESVNLNVWKDCERKQVGPTFLLEDHRGQE